VWSLIPRFNVTTTSSNCQMYLDFTFQKLKRAIITPCNLKVPLQRCIMIWRIVFCTLIVFHLEFECRRHYHSEHHSHKQSSTALKEISSCIWSLHPWILSVWPLPLAQVWTGLGLFLGSSPCGFLPSVNRTLAIEPYCGKNYFKFQINFQWQKLLKIQYPPPQV
jgi:hypothetical protein